MMERYGEVDIIWRSLNKWGRYQMFQTALILTDYIPACFAILSAVFTGYIPDYECKAVLTTNTSDNATSFAYIDNCYVDIIQTIDNISTVVEQTECDHVFAQDNTYSSQWNLVCSRSNLAALAQSLVLGGQGIGAMVMSHLADRFGRKTIHVIAHIGVMCSMLVMAFSSSIYMLLALRLVTGTFQQGIVCTGKILSIEMFPREIRAYMECFGFLAWSFGIVVLTLYGYLFRELSWRYLQIGIVVFSIYSLAEWWLLDESVRWLLMNGKHTDAEKILHKAARWNKVKFGNLEELYTEAKKLQVNKNEHLALQTLEMTNGSPLTGKENRQMSAEKYNIVDILKNPELRVNTFILWYAWFVATGTYYGLTLVSTHLAGDRFVNFALSGVFEAPALILGLYLYNRIGRKKTLILWYAVEGISLIVSTVLLTLFAHIHAVTLVATGFSLIGKMAATGSFSSVFLYTPEIYPTNYRNSGLGIASSISRIGGILAPFASNLALIALWIPGAIFGGMCLLVVILTLRLPESMQHELPSTIKECDEWKQNN